MDRTEFNQLKDKVMTSIRYITEVYEGGLENCDQFESFAKMCENHVDMCNKLCERLKPKLRWVQYRKMKLYKEFHDKGFEIYQVSLDVDKGLWAKVVKEQNLPWVNVCDRRAVASHYVALYNVARLPSAYLIGPDGLESVSFSSADDLRRLVKKSL